MTPPDSLTESSNAGGTPPPGRAIYLGVLLLFFLAIGSYFIYQVAQVALTLLVTLLLAVILAGPVNYLARRGVSRGLAMALVAGMIGLLSWLTGVLIAPVVQQQATQFAATLPGLLEEVEALFVRLQALLGIEAGFDLELGSLLDMGREALSAETLAATAGFGMSVVTVISLGIVALVAAVYLVVRPYPLLDGFVSLFPAERRPRVREILARVYRTVQRWFLGQLLAMTFIGVSSAVALWILGIPFALLLGLFGGLISFIPFVGAVVSAIPPILLALISDPMLAVWVALTYTVIQQIESNVIQPVVMSHVVSLHPAVVLFGVIFMGAVFGFVGLLLAVPLVATVQVLVRELWTKRMDGVGVDPSPPAREGSLRKPGPLRRALGALRNRLERRKEREP